MTLSTWKWLNKLYNCQLNSYSYPSILNIQLEIDCMYNVIF